MQLIFISNYYNHHQSAVAEAFYKLTGGNYRFIATSTMSEERKKLGWGENLPEFVIESYKDAETKRQCIDLINNADIVIVGSAPEKMIRQRIRNEKLVFRYSERIYKNIRKLLQLPLYFIKYSIDNHQQKNVYMLCASGYTARDYAMTGFFKGRTFKWGYFPKVNRYEDIDKLMQEKEKASILCVARLIGWKHLDTSIRVAKRLIDSGYINFKINIIGIGPLYEKLKAKIKENELENHVFLLGAMKPKDVRSHMKKSQIFMFTSDFNEGWGAVLNESMNSGCAVVASHAIGSVPFLIDDGKNGLIYKNGDEDDLFSKVKFLLDNPKMSAELGKNAYKTLSDEWNAENAAKRFLELASEIKRGGSAQELFLTGPCSKAKKLKNNWYKASEKRTKTNK